MQRFRIQITCFLLIFLASITIKAAAEGAATASTNVILLKNGDRVSGNILTRTAESIVISTANLGTITIPVTEVADLKTAMQAAGAGTTVTPPSPPPAPSTSVQISLNAPETVVIGTQNQNTFGGKLIISKNLPDLCAASHWATNLNVGANHDRKWKVQSAANVTDTFRGTLSLNNKAFGKTDWVLVGDFFGNSSIGVGLQQGYGGGLSTFLYSTGCSTTARNYQLTVTGDVSARYLWQRLYAPGGKDNFVGIRPNLGITYTKLHSGSGGTQTEKFDIVLALWAMPMVNDAKAVQAGGAFAFTVPLNKSLSISLNQEDDFVNNAPKLRRKNFLRNTATLKFTFPAIPTN